MRPGKFAARFIPSGLAQSVMDAQEAPVSSEDYVRARDALKPSGANRALAELWLERWHNQFTSADGPSARARHRSAFLRPQR